MYVLTEKSGDNIDLDNEYSLEGLIDKVWSMSNYQGDKPYSFREVVTLADKIGYKIYTIS